MILENPKIYHIAHMDRLAGITAEGYLYSDAVVRQKFNAGTTIGMDSIKQARLVKPLLSYPDLHVGDCVPFYFCPRSVMLYLIKCGNDPELAYQGGETPIIHLEADFHNAIAWAKTSKKRWVFTSENARAGSAEDYNNVIHLDKLNWPAIHNNGWGYKGVDPIIKSYKQAEFLLEDAFPWHLVERIGIHPRADARAITIAMRNCNHRPPVLIMKDWYYGNL